MTVEEAICARVESLTAVIALAGTRVYLDKAPQGSSYPVVVVQEIDDGRTYHFRGPNGLRKARIQVDAYIQEASGEDVKATLIALADAIEGDGLGPNASGLSGWFGQIGSPGINVQGCFFIDRTTPPFMGEELNLLRIRQDYYVNYSAG